MARNKYPEQTIARILEVSTRLFFEKGYENTSVQDILNELKDLSKGAIYHHFKSKEEIFDAVVSKIGESNIAFFTEVKKNTTMSGAEKLRELVRLNISSVATKTIIELAPNLLDNPKFLAIQIKEIRDVVTPKFIAPIVEQGVADGSIKTDKPYELAEAITLLLNVWLNPLVLGSDTSRLASRCKLINEFLQRYDIVLFDEDGIKELEQL